MKTIMYPLKGYQEYLNIEEALNKGRTPLAISGCIDSQKCHFIHSLGKDYKCRVIITYQEMKAKEIVEEYRFYDKQVYYFPARDLLFYSAD